MIAMITKRHVQYQNQNNINFQRLKFKQIDGIKLFEEFSYKIPHKNFSDISNSTDYFVRADNNFNSKELFVNVYSKESLPIGTSHIIKCGNALRNSDIHIESDNIKHNGVGSAMRLGHIITMMENDINKIELFSLGRAIYFHSKFKFEPDIKDNEKIAQCIKHNILPNKDDKRFENIIRAAENWLENKNLSQQEKPQTGNHIIYNYCQTINKYKLNKDKKYEIKLGFEMELSKQKVLYNKDFFNNLFSKFGIDYKID